LTDETWNLVLEELRRVAASTDEMAADVANLKVRLGSVERTGGQIVIALGALGRRTDRLDERLGRIEERLDIVHS
jgi:hypothetical protein